MKQRLKLLRRRNHGPHEQAGMRGWKQATFDKGDDLQGRSNIVHLVMMQIDPGFSWKTTYPSPPSAHSVLKHTNGNYSQDEAMYTPALQLWIFSIRGLVFRPVGKYAGTKVHIDDELHRIDLPLR
ncbi:hypothetical protein CEP54_007259 [Fusarium duplospermum]|uniref:Uncharacterized protein n=1 Tax=Fusarium duplospermum TaxID=1325734 RepID=A0A428Q2M2_9HYPO|nr:hypothetical protein CEP54_007259 [Fusarium duplospermum]